MSTPKKGQKDLGFFQRENLGIQLLFPHGALIIQGASLAPGTNLLVAYLVTKRVGRLEDKEQGVTNGQRLSVWIQIDALHGIFVESRPRGVPCWVWMPLLNEKGNVSKELLDKGPMVAWG